MVGTTVVIRLKELALCTNMWKTAEDGWSFADTVGQLCLKPSIFIVRGKLPNVLGLIQQKLQVMFYSRCQRFAPNTRSEFLGFLSYNGVPYLGARSCA